MNIQGEQCKNLILFVNTKAKIRLEYFLNQISLQCKQMIKSQSLRNKEKDKNWKANKVY